VSGVISHTKWRFLSNQLVGLKKARADVSGFDVHFRAKIEQLKRFEDR
jgi:hypothetical protein